MTKELNPKNLQKLSDDELEESVIKYIFANESESENIYDIVMRKSKSIRMFYATWIVDMEVHNGGFHQFFWNRSGKFAFEALDGYNLLGAKKHAKLMDKAIKLFMKELPKQEKFRKDGTLKSFSESYKHTDTGKLTDDFFAIEKTEDVRKMRIDYLRKHINKE
ncbi:MAG: DUF4375 domain-containing protein [Candidatus Aenigmarchaeota archaeon]|nr:DUF4375 domain-containing protein [Candidatus Aenigmarchaeota archaeon]